MDKDKLEAIQDQGGGSVLEFDGVGRLSRVFLLRAYDKLEASSLDEPGKFFEVANKTAHRGHRESFDTLQEAVHFASELTGKPTESLLVELADRDPSWGSDDHFGMTLEEIVAEVE